MRPLSNVTQRSAEGLGEVLGPVDRLGVTVTHLVSCDRKFGHTFVALPQFRESCRNETVEDKVAVGLRVVHLADEVVGIDTSGSGPSESPSAMSVNGQAIGTMSPLRGTYHVYSSPFLPAFPW